MNFDKEFLKALQKDCRKTGRRLYDCYSGYVMAICLRYLSDSDAAADALQDTFVKILTRIDGFEYRGEGSLKAWIGKIAANEALIHLKRQPLIFTDHLPDVSEEPEEPDVGKVPLDVLYRMIGDLPAGYRAVFNLYVFEQQSHHEIARKLNISEGTSASQLLRAKRQLARKIKEYIKNNR